MRVLSSVQLAALSQLWVLVSEQLTDAFKQVAILIGLMALSNEQVNFLALFDLSFFSLSLIGSGIYMTHELLLSEDVILWIVYEWLK